ncbi:MAG: TspO protein [Candidatus Yanofskybacteria bacterium CG10_big_fil_rev_8_21_14_0_10_36_16]|uniref:TspO protein n=1 Tax=Candidatus Yanofskybacteria bacterium CG10_big_fil_rev_8_21_14_0_10_36_16 TaxID=1975096 RepID=A0A2J0Q7T2_9BACT|nr:MAG: TspO protein [Candidatus Yanofskybacteria bacterium CG10_big_fil_rev_8_21_14_0_10_36_16]
MKINIFFKLVIAITVSQSAGVIGSLFTFSAIPNWYATITKPALNPPAWVFGPVWTILYTLMGVAAFLVWRNGWSQRSVRTALSIFGFQLLLNAIWSIIFFGFKNPGLALVDIVVLWFAIVWTIKVFYKISKLAAYLLVPYLLWVSFATYLNYAIWALN